MSTDYVIPDDVLQAVLLAVNNGDQWMVYNTGLYFLELQDICFFKTREEALEFCRDNTGDRDCFNTLHVTSLPDLLRQLPYGTRLNNFLSETNTPMNEKNFDYLKDQVKYTGFGDALENALKQKLQQGSPEFQIYHNTKFGNDTATATLHFKKSD